VTPKTLTRGKRSSRPRILAVVLFALSSLLVTTKCIFAQSTSGIVGAKGVYCSGTADNFNCPEEPTTPDPALLNMLTAQYARDECFGFLDFDEFPSRPDCIGTPIPRNALFVHRMTFPVPSGGITSATLQFRVKAAPTGQTNNDFIAFFEGTTYITGSNLNQLPGASGTWNPNQDVTFSLDLSNLPSGFSPNNNILHYLNDGYLDVVIGNETGVDWMCLYVPTVNDSCKCGPRRSITIAFGTTGTTVNNNGTATGVIAPQTVTITPHLQCVPSTCLPSYQWSYYGPSSNSGTTTTQFQIPSTQAGTYTVRVIGICGTQRCDSIRFSIEVIQEWRKLIQEGVLTGDDDPVNRALNDWRQKLARTVLGVAIEKWYADLTKQEWVSVMVKKHPSEAKSLLGVGRKLIERNGTLDKPDLEIIEKVMRIMDKEISRAPGGLIDESLKRLRSSTGKKWAQVMENLAK
jgi:hypothetical protein